MGKTNSYRKITGIKYNTIAHFYLRADQVMHWLGQPAATPKVPDSIPGKGMEVNCPSFYGGQQ